MKYLKFASLILILLLFFSVYGCFKEVVGIREPLPDIIWPKPPEIPRIRFVNSISKPEDLDIREKQSIKFLRFLKGKIKRSMVNPYGLAGDSDGRLFVVDNFNKYVHVFDEKNGDYYVFPQEETSLASPIGIATDKKGAIYVSDSKNSVVKVFENYGKKYIRDIGKDFLERPTGIAVNEKSGELLVVDTINSEIIRYDLESYKFKGKIGRMGSEPGIFHYPTNIFVSREGLIFVSDSLNFRIQIFTPDGKFLNAFGKPGDGPGYFARPRGVAVDSDGNIYVVDALFDNVQVFNKNGELLMDFGGPGHGYGEFWLPSGIFIDSSDRIYVSDSYNQRVQVFQYMKGDNSLNP